MLPSELKILLLKRNGKWHEIIEAYGCSLEKDSDLAPYLETLPLKLKYSAYLELGFAYSQLSNIQKKRKEILNADEFVEAYNKADTIYEKMLSLWPDNITVLTTAAYLHYKIIVAYCKDPIEKKEYKRQHWDIVGEFNVASDLFQRVLDKDTTNIRANYRYAKMMLYVLEEKSNDNVLKRAVKEKPRFRYTGYLNNIIRMFHATLAAYEALPDKDKPSHYSYFIKSHYNLACACIKIAMDNFYKKEIQEEFFKNPNRPGFEYGYSYYAQSSKRLREARLSLIFILTHEYTFNLEKFDAKAIVLPVKQEKTKYPISPKDVFYRLGQAYARHYQIAAVSNGRDNVGLDLAKRAIKCFCFGIQYALWVRKKGYNPRLPYGYISKGLHDLKRIMGLDEKNSEFEDYIRTKSSLNWLDPEEEERKMRRF